MSLKPGLHGEASLIVSEENTAQKMGSGSLAVLATPALVALMEKAATKAIAEHLPEGQTTVGIRVDIHHLAPTPIGMEVKARAKLTGVEGQRLHFQVEAGDQTELIARGEHYRVMVPAESFLQRAQTKNKKSEGN